MANSDQVQLGFTQEATYGTSPTGEAAGQATIAAAEADNSINDSGVGFISDGFTAGQFITISGFTATNNNGGAQIVSVTAGKMVLRGITLTDEAEGDTVVISKSLKSIRFTAEDFYQNTGSVNSTEIRPDRQIVDVVRTELDAAGSLNYELSYNAFDEFLEAVLMSDDSWTAEVETLAGDTGISVVSGTQRLEGADGDFADYTEGAFIRISGFTETANNGVFRIVSIDSSSVGVSDDDIMVLDSGTTLVTEAAGDPITITQASYITNGVLDRTFTMQKTFTDLTGSAKYAIYKGMALSTVSMTIAPDQIITGTFGFMGKNAVSASTSESDADIAAATKFIESGVDNISSVRANGETINTTSISFELNNNIRARKQIGTLGPVSLGYGKVELSGTFQQFYSDVAQMDIFLNFTTVAFVILFSDSADNLFIVHIPYAKYTSGKRVAGGENTDVIADMAWTAFRNADVDYTIRISKIDA